MAQLDESRRIVHRIAGSSLTFGVDSVASIARVCEHVLKSILAENTDLSSHIVPEEVDKISRFISDLYDSCHEYSLQFQNEAETVIVHAQTQYQAEQKIKNIQPLNGMHILVADDDPVMRVYIQKKLEKRGFKISLAEDGLEAYNMAVSLKPDLILMDGLMPKLDGFEAVKKIRENRTISHIPVFMLTALDDQENVADSLICGANDYIIKPFDVTDIVEKIKKACKK